SNEVHVFDTTKEEFVAKYPLSPDGGEVRHIVEGINEVWLPESALSRITLIRRGSTGLYSGPFSPEPIGPREALGRQAAGLGAGADPRACIRRPCPARTVAPAQAVGQAERLDVAQAPVAVLLQPHPAAARHAGEFRQREHQQLAVL